MARIVVGATGASGYPILRKCLEILRGNEVYLIITDSGRLSAECEDDLKTIFSLATEVIDIRDMSSPIASGTFHTEGMLIVPCSMKSAAGIASGYSDNALLRAADVTIKEKRPLVLGVRECPMSPIHLRNLSYLSSLPLVTVMPLVMTFYNGEKTIDDMVTEMSGRLLRPFGVDISERWVWKGLKRRQ